MEPITAVTGSTGFIGPHLVRKLLARGTRLRLLVRRKPAFFKTLPKDVEIVSGDITDADAVGKLLNGTDTVFHLAGYAKPWARHPAEYYQTNVEGTRLVCETAAACGAKRLVHVSTALVVPPAGTKVTPVLTDYQRTKMEAETIVKKFAARGLGAVIVQPSRVFGPGTMSHANSVTKMIAQYQSGLFRFRLQDGGARGNYVFVEDVVDGIISAAEIGVVGHAYALGGEDRTVPEFLSVIANITGKSHRVFPVPLSLAKGIGATAALAGRFGIPPVITSQWVELLALDWPVDSSEAKRDLGFAPKPLHFAIGATLDWLGRGRPALDFSTQAPEYTT